MRCPSLASLAAHTTLRHDILKGILRHVAHRAGIASTQEHALRLLPGLAREVGTSPLETSTQVEALGDILLARRIAGGAVRRPRGRRRQGVPRRRPIGLGSPKVISISSESTECHLWPSAPFHQLVLAGNPGHLDLPCSRTAPEAS
jgi:hypothetical protein